MPLDVALSRLRCFSNHTSGFENLAGRLNKAPDSAHLMTEMAARGATVEALESLYRADLPRFVRAATAIVGSGVTSLRGDIPERSPSPARGSPEPTSLRPGWG